MIAIIKTFAVPAAVAAAALVSTAAYAAASGEFTVVNRNSGLSIQRVWTAPAGTTYDWKETYLNYPIAPGSSSRFTFASTNTCLYDLKVRFSDGVSQTFSNVNVCRGDRALAD